MPPQIVSYTDGQGPAGYTELSASHFAQARALADASNLLPYFAGTGASLARCYPDRVLSSASVHPVLMITALGCVLVIGLICGFFVPKLPLDVPKRGFDLYSWLAAFQADELVGDRMSGLPKNLELREIQSQLGDLKFRYSH